MRSLVLLSLLSMSAVLAACEKEAPPRDYVARVYDSYLSRDDLSESLASLPFRQDSSEATQQIIEQWVSNELLFHEAQRLGLKSDPEVQRLLREGERSVLISALISKLYSETDISPSTSEVQGYYLQHRDQLRLRQPFLRVRYLNTPDEQDAAQARARLQAATAAGTVDSLWQQIAHAYAANEDEAVELAASYYPESRLFNDRPVLRSAIAGLDDNQMTPVIEADSLYHVVQVVDRVASGTVPQLPWIQDEVERRLVIQSRKQLYARQVQRLRNEAQAKEALDVQAH